MENKEKRVHANELAHCLSNNNMWHICLKHSRFQFRNFFLSTFIPSSMTSSICRLPHDSLLTVWWLSWTCIIKGHNCVKCLFNWTLCAVSKAPLLLFFIKRIILTCCRGIATMMLYTGFVWSWKTWKSHGILKWSFPGLEKSWEKTQIIKVMEMLSYSHVLLRRVWKNWFFFLKERRSKTHNVF